MCNKFVKFVECLPLVEIKPFWLILKPAVEFMAQDSRLVSESLQQEKQRKSTTC